MKTAADVSEADGAVDGGEATVAAAAPTDGDRASSSRESSASNHNENSTLLTSTDLQLPNATGRSARERR